MAQDAFSKAVEKARMQITLFFWPLKVAPHVLEGQGPVRHRQDVWWASVCAVHVRRGHEEPSGRDHEW